MNYYLQLAIFVFIYMNFWFMLSVRLKRNDIADVAWGPGFVLLSWVSMLMAEAYNFQNLLLSILISIWGIRLSWHIGARNCNKSEDFRYNQWRSDWGKFLHLRAWLQVYMLQGTFLFLIALPVVIYHIQGPHALSWYFIPGIILWCIGFYFEATSDYQLARFKKDPKNKGKIIRTGLWKFSRHPNYFGEVLIWWGVYLMCLPYIPIWPSIISPVLITCLIVFVSGIPMLEKKYKGNSEYENYKKSTSVFFPLPPKV